MTAYNTVKTALESADLSEKARDVILTLIDGEENDEEREIEHYVEALEDGGMLAAFGFNDQEAVEDAHAFLESIE